MIELLNALSRSLSPLWEMSLTAAYAAAVVALLRLVLRKRAPKQVLCLLWLVVFARLLIPVSLESPLSILPDDQQVQAVQNLPSKLTGQNVPGQTPAQNPEPAQNPGSGVIADPVSQGNVNAAPALTVPGSVSPTKPQPEGQAEVKFPWQALMAGVWLAGAAAMGLYGVLSSMRLKARLYDAIRAEDGAWEHPSVGSPFILGMIRPKIYLPAGLCGMPRRFILCHERAHLRRLDHIVKPICWVALALHWFNPAVWMAFILMSKDIEAACDEAVIRRLGPRVKADYSATLLSLATNGRVPAPCPLAFDEGDARGRIQNVLHYRRPALWIVVVSAVMALLAAVCLLTDPVSAEEPDADPEPNASASQAPEGLDGLLDPWMEEILAGRQNFVSAETGETVNIDLLNGAYPGEFTVTLSKFAVVDLNRDGINELVLWPSIDGIDSLERISTLGYLILHRVGDDVTSYNPSYRSFAQIKTDGTFCCSGGAASYGYGLMRFQNGEYTVDLFTYSYTSFDDNNEQIVSYFVDGRSAEEEEFSAAIAAEDAKPDVTWHRFAAGAEPLPGSIRVPIPLDDYVKDGPVPDFLDGDQQLLYRQALTMYSHIFGPNTEAVDDWPDGGGFQYDYQNPYTHNGASYVPATGLYANWDDFEEAVLSVFTRDFWTGRNGTADTPTYINNGGILFYRPAARGNYGCNSNFPETFRLVERTEDSISFIATGYYSDPWPMEGESYEERDLRLASYWEYSVEYPMRMVRTEQGWRFDQFYSVYTDSYSNPQIPNPNIPVVTNTPEPTPAPERTVIAEADGIQIVSVGGVYRLHWEQNGQDFPVGPDAASPNYEPWLEDFDEDGNVEAVFPQTGSFPFTIYDFVGGALRGYPLPDIYPVYNEISLSSVAAYNPATGGLTMTFPWGEGDSRRYVTLTTTLSSDFFAGCEELTDGRPLRMSVTAGSINGMGVPSGLSYRARVALTDGTTTSPEVGYMWFGILYSDRGFEIRTPEASDFGTDFRA